MARIFITGGTGYIGRAVVSALVDRGDCPVVLTRNPARARESFGPRAGSLELVDGDPTGTGEWQGSVAGCKAVINLAGESLGADRWNARVKQLIHHSRIDTTRHVVEAMASAPKDQRPSVLVSASGADYYPFDVDLDVDLDSDEDEVDEDTSAGDHFLARVCQDWEREALESEQHGVRVVCMRQGIVVGGEGSAIDRWARVFDFFVGGKLGNGRQWMSWVHRDDVVRAYLFAVDRDDLRGPVNLVSPNRMRNREFAAALAAARGRPKLFPVPGFALRAALGPFAEYLLNGRPVAPVKLREHGFTFERDQPFA